MNFLVGLSFPAGLQAQAQDPEGKASPAGNRNHWSQQGGSKALPVMDSNTMKGLTFTARLQVPTHLRPTCSLYKPASVFSTWETVFETLVPVPGVGVSLSEINSFHVPPPPVSLPLDFVSNKWRSGSVCEPRSRVPSHPGALPTTEKLETGLFISAESSEPN